MTAHQLMRLAKAIEDTGISMCGSFSSPEMHAIGAALRGIGERVRQEFAPEAEREERMNRLREAYTAGPAEPIQE